MCNVVFASNFCIRIIRPQDAYIFTQCSDAVMREDLIARLREAYVSDGLFEGDEKIVFLR